MDLSFRAAFIVLGVIALFGLTESAVTIATGTLVANLAENSAAGTTVTTLTASGDTAPHTFEADGSQEPDLAWFTVASTGIVTVATGKTVDYESTSLLAGKTYKVPVKAMDNTSPTAVTGSGTIVITITNVKECHSSDDTIHRSTGALAADASVGSVAASDLGTGTVTYGVSGCNSEKFSVSTAGLLKVATGKSLAVGESYILAITAKDDNATPLTCTTYSYVCVGACSTTCSGAISLTGSLLSIASVLILLQKHV